MGNLATTTGTPVLSVITLACGFTEVLAFVVPLAIGGFLVPEWMVRRRARCHRRLAVERNKLQKQSFGLK